MKGKKSQNNEYLMNLHPEDFHLNHHEEDQRSGHIKKIKSSDCLHKLDQGGKPKELPEKKLFLQPGTSCSPFEQTLSTTVVQENGFKTYLMAKALNGPALHYASQVCNQKQPPKKPSKKIPEISKAISGDLAPHLHGYSTITHEGIYRKNNEDKVTIFLEGDYKWFSIYDGHGGSACSQFLKDHLHEEFFSLDWRKDTPNALRQAFINAEAKWQKKGDNSGSCALVIFIHDNVCYTANLGDSRAVLASQRGLKCYQMTKDHKPSNAEEQKRVMESNGKIYQTTAITEIDGMYDMIVGPLRVFPGRLSTTRTFGDSEAKNEGNNQVVICEPQISSFQIDEHDFIVMGSDGLWDRLSNLEIVQMTKSIYEKGFRNEEWLSGSTQALLQEAMQRGSTDNISLIMISISDLQAEKTPKKGNQHIKIMGSINSNVLRRKTLNNQQNSFPDKMKEIDSRINEINRNASRILQSRR